MNHTDWQRHSTPSVSRAIQNRANTKFENLRVPRTCKGVLFVGKDFRAWCCAGDEGFGPSSPPVRRVAANHHMLRWLKTVVVSDVEKAHVMRQVGIGKTVRSPRFGDR
jgi:hypothetical protein